MPTTAAEGRFQRLYRDYQRPVYLYFRRRTDLAGALDGAADTFLVAWRRLDEVPEGDRTLAWLYGVARRVLANQRRSNARFRRLQARLRRFDGASVATPETIVVRRFEDEALLRAVAELRPDDQELLRLVTWEELPREDVAALLDTTPHAVAQRLYRITKRLARELHAPSHRREPRVAPWMTGNGGTP